MGGRLSGGIWGHGDSPHAHACTHMHAHTCIEIANGHQHGGIMFSMFNMHVRVCMHACVCM